MQDAFLYPLSVCSSRTFTTGRIPPTLLLLFLLGILASSSAIGGTALPPILIVGPACEQMPDGLPPTRPYAYIVFEDRNGDGTYDYYTRFACDGIAYQGPYNPEVQSNPFNPGGAPVGALPPGMSQLYYELHFNGALTSAGGYQWFLEERRVADNGLASRWSRNPNDGFSGLFFPPEARKSGSAGID